jgi:catechol 2,3-dioxygenase-like lactoylglutathione lyase family enzyme
MNIIGPDALIFGVDDVAACSQYLSDYGLTPVNASASGGRFEALDGTAIVIAHKDDTALPAPLPTASMLRKTVYGVADQATLAQLADDLARDREVKQLPDGSFETTDDAGFVLGFQVTVRRVIDIAAESVNAPGAPAQRKPNVTAVDEQAVVRPRTLSHVVYFVPDVAKAEAFYVDRLGFRCTDRLAGAGPFLQPAGTLYHLGGPTELMLAGTRFVNKGYQSFWGPGRHKFGSNWFWYFNSPLGCHVEYDADMDLHDASWQARTTPMSADASQLFLFQSREKWAPGGPPPGAAGGPPGAAPGRPGPEH